MRHRRTTGLLTALLIAILLGMTLAAGAGEPAPRLPWAKAGLTERQAAAHLLDRFAFGARPGDVDRVVALGISRWFEQQLGASVADPDLEHMLRRYKSLGLSAEQLVETYPPPTRILREAREAGVVGEDERDLENPQLRQKLRAYGQQQGYRPLRELLSEMEAQKVVRAIYSQNQLEEVLVDFWFNHFNVSTTDNQARPYVLSYERDAIRPHALGRFRDLLGATAHHPAMLLYLDNAQSSAAPDATTSLERALADKPLARRRVESRRNAGNGLEAGNRGAAPSRPRRGINENYARELLELHTLGVEGGYDQDDVIAVARAFTGWTVFPSGARGKKLEKRLERGRQLGFYRNGLFLFRPDTHDAGAKALLGEQMPAGGGMEEGERVLDLVSHRRQTARRIAQKLAVRFVSDDPEQGLVDRLADVFMATEGDIKAMVRAIAESPEFWGGQARRSKIKSPLELVVSALRATDARLQRPQEVVEWIGRLGEPLYACQPPTGYPDRAEAWVNSGSLMGRMNFGLQLGTGELFGVRTNLLALNHGHEPESLEAALRTYTAILMPERDVAETLMTLAPVALSPGLAARLEAASQQQTTGTGGRTTSAAQTGSPGGVVKGSMAVGARAGGSGRVAGSAMPSPDGAASPGLESQGGAEEQARGAGGPGQKRQEENARREDEDMVDLSSGEADISSTDITALESEPAPATLAQVVGVILGSPEFQRH